MYAGLGAVRATVQEHDELASPNAGFGDEQAIEEVAAEKCDQYEMTSRTRGLLRSIIFCLDRRS